MQSPHSDMNKYLTLLLPLLLLCSPLRAQESKSYLPTFHGTVRTKYEYQPDLKAGRFEVRNARVGIEGDLIPILGYKAEIDLSDEGVIKMLDAYVRVKPIQDLYITMGQMRVPFTIDAHRSPHLRHFINRSFISKQVANVRDVGAELKWKTGSKQVPITLQTGIFNGSGVTNQKNYWTSNYNYNLKAQTLLAEAFNITLSFQQSTAHDVKVHMYDIGTFYESSRWHVEAEFLRKHYRHSLFPTVTSTDCFIIYRQPLRRVFQGISFLARHDYMSDHSNGEKNEEGLLTVTDAQRHRLTGGLTLHMGDASLQADLRLNYEQYFYRSGAVIGISDHHKLAIELVAHF